MNSSSKARSLGSDFTLGGEQAEADPLLERAFYHSGHYAAIERRDDMRCFLIGRTGGGKSAVLQHLETEHREHVIRIDPEDLSLPYITDLGVIRYLASLNVHLDLFFIALWKHVLLVEVIRHRYKVDSPVAKNNFFNGLRERTANNPSKRMALDYFNKFQDKFWVETDERVKDITSQFEEEVNSEARASFAVPHVASLGVGSDSSAIAHTEMRTELADRFQRIVNNTQLSSLNDMIKILDEYVLDSSQNFTYIVIDDLDKDWVDEKITNTLIRCLFRAVLDLKKVGNLKILVALRTNIFEELDFGGRTGGQEEKFRSLSLRIRWTPAEIISLLSERARVAASQYGMTSISGIRDLLPAPSPTRGRGNAITFILSRTLMRPRDAIAYLNECLVLASGKSRLTWKDLQDAEKPYSLKRLLALRDEWKPTYPGIDRLFNVFTRCPSPMTREELTSRLDDSVMLLADAKFAGILWMTDLTESIWANVVSEWVDMYYPLLRLLFNLGFIGSGSGSSPTYFYDDPDYAEQISNFETATKFYIHPAFRAALDVER